MGRNPRLRGRAPALAVVALLAVALGTAGADDEAPAPPGLAGRGTPPAPTADSVEGRVERAGKGVVAQVSAWALPSMDERALTRARTRENERRAVPWSPEKASPSWWLSSEAVAKTTRVLSKREPADAEGRSGADGRFRLEARAASDAWVVLATAPDGLEVFTAVRRAEDGTREPVVLRLPGAGAAVEVRLRHHDGTPYRGAVAPVVDPLPFSIEDAIPPRLADEGGRARFGVVPDGVYRLRCTHLDGTVSWSPRSAVPLGGPWAFVVDEPTREVPGTVRTPADAPVDGASVRVFFESSERQTLVGARSDADGVFRLRLPARKGTLAAEAPGHEPASLAVAADAKSVAVVVAPFGALRGRVVAAATGAGVAGVPVHVFPVDAPGDGLPFAAVSGADGSFEIASPPTGPVRLLAFGAGYMSAEVEDVVYGGFDPLLVDVAAASSRPVTLTVVPAARLEGRVVDAEGAPVAGARIGLAQSDAMSGMCGVGYRRCPMFPFLPDPEGATSDADGRFVLDTLRPALLYHLGVRAEGFEPLHRPVVLEETGPTSMTFTLGRYSTKGPPRTVVARVVAAELPGGPLAGARVSLSMYPEETREAVADERGLARFDAVPAIGARLDVSFGERIDAGQQVPLDSAGGGREVTVTLALERATTITGRVLSPRGEPVPDATVGAGRENDPGNYDDTQTSEDGRFVLRNVPPRPVSLYAQALHRGARLHRSQDVTGGARDVVIRLVEDRTPSPFPETKAHPVRIPVVDPEGRPVPRGRYALVAVRESRSEFVEEFAGGAVDIAPADVGQWSVVAFAGEPAGGGPLLGPAETPPFSVGAPPKDLVLRMTPGRVLSGRVVASDGKAPVAGVTLLVYDPRTPVDWRRPPNARGRATSGADGEFRIEGLGDAAVLLALQVPRSFVAPEPREVAAGDGMEIRLGEAVQPWITVLDADGRPVEGALVAVGAGGSEPRTLWDYDHTLPRTGPTGRVRLGGLDPAQTYTLVVGVPSGPYNTREVRRSAWRPEDTVVRAAPTATVSGRLRSPDGAPIEGAWIAFDPGDASPPAEWKGGSASAADGTFTMKDVPPGPGTVRFGVGRSGPSGELAATAPSTDVDVVLDPGPTWTFTLEAPRADPAGALTVWWTPWREDGAPTKENPNFRTIAWTPTLRFHGLLPDHRYALYVLDEAADLVAWVPDLPGSGGTRRLALVPAGKITGRVRFADPSDEEYGAFVEVEDRGLRRSDLPEKAEFTITGLPPGRFTVRASVFRLDPTPPSGATTGTSPNPEATATVATGDSVVLDVPARPR